MLKNHLPFGGGSEKREGVTNRSSLDHASLEIADTSLALQSVILVELACGLLLGVIATAADAARNWEYCIG